MNMIPTCERPRMRSAIAVAAVILAAAVLVAGGCGGGRGPVAPTKIVLLGIDGMDWRLAEPLLKEGKLPNLARIMKQGTHTDLRSLEVEMKSPIIWTTIATGKGPQKHGISDFVGPDGQAPLMNSNGWRARPVWDILGEKGRSVGIINWMVNWPAKPVSGYNVTDRIIFTTEDGFPEPENVTYPPELAAELAPYRHPIATTTDEEIAPFLNGDAWRTTTNPDIGQNVEGVRIIYGNDETILGVTKHLLESRPQPDFLAVYLNGLDVACHSFWGAFDPTSLDIQATEEYNSTFRDVIPRYYERIDALMGEVLKRVDPGSTVIVCSDHGFRGPLRTAEGLRLGIWMHGAHGVLAADGPGIKKGAKVTDASVFDITPTLLALLGAPVGRDMDGFVLTSMIDERFLKDHPVTYVDSYEKTGAAEAEGEPVTSPVDDEIKERLRSLGYIE
jgi:predicted AlkP superfamily phosphohydrolase/phosphomutase